MILPWLKQKGFYDSEVRLILIDEKAKLKILSWSVKWERNTSRQQKKLINYVTKGENSKRTLMNGFSCSGKEDVDMGSCSSAYARGALEKVGSVVVLLVTRVLP
jgi:hypothetical protein